MCKQYMKDKVIYSFIYLFQEKFRDLLILKLLKKFIKKPSRLSVLDLQDICESIMPRDVDTLIKLKANVKVILEVSKKKKMFNFYYINITTNMLSYF